MEMLGTIVNGSVQLDTPSELPDGTRVMVYEDEDDLEEFEYPHPMAPYDREKEIALLKERIAEVDAGQVIDAREFMKQWAKKRGFDTSGES